METAELVTKVEAELARLDVHTTRHRPEGLSVYADADLPRGWVRVSDGTGEAYGDAAAIAAVLAAVPASGEVTEDGALDWDAAWEALGEFGDRAPTTVRDWPAGLVATEQIEEGDCNDQPITVVTVETNAGTRYAAGPHGVHTDTLHDWLDNGCDLKKTRGAALAAANREQSESN